MRQEETSGSRVHTRRRRVVAFAALLGAGITAGLVPVTLADAAGGPQITNVTGLQAAADQSVTITGTGFGAGPAFKGNEVCFLVTDVTAGWSAGHADPQSAPGSGTGGACSTPASNAQDLVQVVVNRWSDTLISFNGFSGAYGQGSWAVSPGDRVEFVVWNAQTGSGPARFTVTAAGASLAVPAGTPASRSGQKTLAGEWTANYHCLHGRCAGQDFPAHVVITHFDAVRASFEGTYEGSQMIGTIRSGHLTIVVVKGSYTSTGTGVLSADWNSVAGVDGSAKDTNGTSGSWTMQRVGAPGGGPGGTSAGQAGGSATATGSLTKSTGKTGPFVASSSRSSLLAIPNPGDALTVKNVALAGLITLLLFTFVAFPSTLFNNTLESNIDVFRRWLPRWMRARERPTGQVARTSFWHTNQGYLTFVLIAGLLYSRMQPGFGMNRGTFQTFLSFLVGAVVTTSIGLTVTRRYLVRRLHGTGHLEVELGTLAFAVVCVVASRLADFVPGYFYGVVAIFVATTQPSDEDKGRMAVIATTVTLSIAVIAWLLFSPLDHVASSGNLFAQLPRSLAGGLFSGGTQALAIGLTPIKFLPGATLRRWNAKLWGVFYAAGLFLFSLGLLHPGLTKTREASMAWTLALAVTFAVASIAFWYYFRRRAENAAHVAAHPAPSTDPTEAVIDLRDRVAETGPSPQA